MKRQHYWQEERLYNFTKIYSNLLKKNENQLKIINFENQDHLEKTFSLLTNKGNKIQNMRRFARFGSIYTN